MTMRTSPFFAFVALTHGYVAPYKLTAALRGPMTGAKAPAMESDDISALAAVTKYVEEVSVVKQL